MIALSQNMSLDEHTPLQQDFFIHGICEFSSHVLSWPKGMYKNMTRKHLDIGKRYAVTQHILGCYESPEGSAHFEMLPPSHFALWLILCGMLRDVKAKEDVVNMMRLHHGLERYSKWSTRRNAWPDGYENWADAQHILLHYTRFQASARCSRIVHCAKGG